MADFDAHTVADDLIDLGRLALTFSLVERGTCHPDGETVESDADHTVMLGLIGCALARRYFPRLDVGLISQYALVHDLPEAYAGDTPTLVSLSVQGKVDKQQREHLAFLQIAEEFGGTLPWVVEMIADYEALATPEACFVKALDKLLPKVTQILNGAVTVRRAGMNRAALAARHQEQIVEMRAYAAGFPELFAVLDILIDRILVMLDE